MLDSSLVGSVFLVACASIAKASLVAGGGIYLARNGIINDATSKGVSGVAVKLCLPCLLFERIARTVTWQMLAESWVIVPFALIYVTLGCALGYLVTWTLGTPKEHVRSVSAAVGFANSQGLPIVFVEVIGSSLFDEETAELGIAYVAIYLVLYLVLQWTVGAALLGVPVGNVEPAITKKSQPGTDDGDPHQWPANCMTPTSIACVDGVGLQLRTISPPSEQQIEGAVMSAGANQAPHYAVLLTDKAAGDDTDQDDVMEGDELVLDTLPNDDVEAVQLPASSKVRNRLCGIFQRILVPPVYGIALGLLVALSPLSIVFGGPLQFVMQAARMLGGVAIPVSMMILGASLQKGPSWDSVHMPTVFGVVFCKMLVLPSFALVVVTGLVHAGLEAPKMLLLVILLESAMPTANNVLIMCELAGGQSTKAMSTTIFVQYCAAPFLLTLTMSTFMLLVK